MVINPSCTCVDAAGIINLDGLRNWTHVRPTEHLRWGPRHLSSGTICSTGNRPRRSVEGRACVCVGGGGTHHHLVTPDDEGTLEEHVRDVFKHDVSGREDQAPVLAPVSEELQNFNLFIFILYTTAF